MCTEHPKCAHPSVSCLKNVSYISHFKVDGLIITTPLSKQTLKDCFLVTQLSLKPFWLPSLCPTGYQILKILSPNIHWNHIIGHSVDHHHPLGWSSNFPFEACSHHLFGMCLSLLICALLHFIPYKHTTWISLKLWVSLVIAMFRNLQGLHITFRMKHRLFIIWPYPISSLTVCPMYCTNLTHSPMHLQTLCLSPFSLCWDIPSHLHSLANS